jgi:hypothetical protein
VITRTALLGFNLQSDGGGQKWVQFIFLIVKRIEINLGFEPIKNAPNFHIEWKGDW